MKLWQSLLTLATTTLISPQVFAHANHISTHMGSHATSSFMTGLIHPFSGTDHILTLLLAGILIARFAAGQIKVAISTLSLLMVSYLWLHGTEIATMNSEFAMGFLASSLAICGLAFIVDKFIFSKLITRHA